MTMDTTATTAKPSVPLTSFPVYVTAVRLWYVIPPILISLGTFGNVMTIIIMRRMMSQESTVNLYFMGTAVLDMVFLYTLTLTQWTRYTFNFRINGLHDVVCKIHTWLYTGSSTISCWYLVCLTVHRAMSVVWPHRVSTMCTRRTVLLLLMSVGVVLAVLYAHALITVGTVPLSKGSSSLKCVLKSEHASFVVNAFVYVELLLYSLLPFACLVCANAVLVWKLTMSVRNARKHLAQGDPDQILAREKTANSVTLTVIVVSLAFLVLTLPTSINFIQSFYVLTYSKRTDAEVAELFFVATIRSLLGHSNAAVNFYLYCLTGARFREEFLSVLGCGRNRSLPAASSSAVGDSKRTSGAAREKR
ncbi:uncharacterized protein LOC143300025 [Babylonia areolata]|uniref:uncharacterized protein LOC143300025 n=1 Tax=Babylonia areolata TaxID=304850 RepID=UPI003FD01952